MRITNTMLTTRALRDLQTNFAALAKSQEQVSTGRKLNRASDDPAQARVAVKVRDNLNALAQHIRNIDTAERSTSTAETALTSASEVMQRVKELAIQASNDTLSASDRQAIAHEVSQLSDELVTLANTKSGEDYVFAGQATHTQPYASAAAAYTGDTNSINARVAPGVTMAINVTGNTAFGPALSAIVQLQTDLATGTGHPPGTTLTALDAGYDAVLGARAQIGTIDNRLTSTRIFVESSQDAATKLLSDLEDADMAQVISDAASRQAVYEAALSVNAKILRRSLFDEL
jgi:flagellar hook-associated protein 3 FlgL